MTNVLTAVNVLIALTELAGQLGPRLQRVANMIAAAQAEGRDLTDTELAQIQVAREEAVAAWRALDHDADA